MIASIAFTVYPVSDMPAARRFYEGSLGLVSSLDFEGRWVEYDIGGGTFALSTMDPRPPSGNRGVIAFEVDDFDATIGSLKSAGIPFSFEVFETPVCRMAGVADPDGNEVIVHKLKS